MFEISVLLAVLQLVYSREFLIENNLQETINVFHAGVIHKNNFSGRFKLAPSEKYQLFMADIWSGHFCARIGNCQNGACDKWQCEGPGIPPMTIAQFYLNVSGLGVDKYFVSLVHGYNLGVQIEPLNKAQDPRDRFRCGVAGCKNDLNLKCPNALKAKNASGQVVACKSSCFEFNTDQYCCRGYYDTPKTCQISQWPVNSAKYFKTYCPDVFTYVYDNNTKPYTCSDDSKYKVTFFTGNDISNIADSVTPGNGLQQFYVFAKLQILVYILRKFSMHQYQY